MGYSATNANTNKRRGIYLSQELEDELTGFAARHKVSFNEVMRTAGLALLELERRGVEVRMTGVQLVGPVPTTLTTNRA